MPGEVPQSVPEGVPQDVPQSVPQDVPEGVPQDVLEGVPQDVLEGVPQDVLEGVPQDVLEGVPQDVLEEVPAGVAENVPQDVVEGGVSTTGSGSRTDNTSGDPDLEVPAKVPQDVAEAVAAALGRAPQGRYRVVVSHPGGAPRVIRNSPFLDDGTPMPTLYWLVCPTDRRAVSRLESAGGVKAAEAAVDAAELAAAHAAYASERDADIPIGQEGPRPSGGVGGTRRGVKCLHAHYAWYLAGGGDPVGAWVAARLSSQEENDDQNDARKDV